MLEAPLEKVHKIKLLKEEKIQLVYVLVNDQECDIKYKDQARPEFYDAMAEVLQPTLDLLELPKAYAFGMSVRGISLSWKDDIMGAVIYPAEEAGWSRQSADPEHAAPAGNALQRWRKQAVARQTATCPARVPG